jgi:hypothetical protein
MATRAQIAKIAATIEELARKIDPAPELALIIIDPELDELLGYDATELVHRRHVQLFPSDRHAKKVLLVRTGSTRDTPHGQADRASGQLLAEIRARRQKQLAITWQPPEDVPLQ